MSAERISKVVLGADGKPRRRLASGRSVRLKGRTDWKRLAAMKEAELVARARSDRDARPVARRRLAEFQRVTLTGDEVKAIGPCKTGSRGVRSRTDQPAPTHS